MTDSLLRVCRQCGHYTFSDACPEGHGSTRTPHPPRYSPHDRWGKYRRALYAAGPSGGA